MTGSDNGVVVQHETGARDHEQYDRKHLEPLFPTATSIVHRIATLHIDAG